MSLFRQRSSIDREGVVTDCAIAAGEWVHTMDGERVSPLELVVRLATKRLRSADDVFVLGYFSYILPDPLSLAINHSCDPNCGIRGERELCALRPIASGEEITFDYSTTVKGTVPWQMAYPCKCGAPNCRGIVGNVATIPEATFQRYVALDAVPRPFRITRRFRIGEHVFGI